MPSTDIVLSFNKQTHLVWLLVGWRHYRISHKFITSVKKRFDNLLIIRFGKSDIYFIEGDSELDIMKLLDRIEFERCPF